MFDYRAKSIRNLRRLAVAWQAESELERLVAAHHGRLINKWSHFFPIYSRHFGHLRDRRVRILEIGVARGGSLDVWRKFFGDQAEITGLDILPDTKQFEQPGTRIYVGDQGDRELLTRIAEERGPFDIVIEDGSHQFEHQILAFEILFDHLIDRGLYACEDIQTSYLDEFGGGVGKPGTFAEFTKRLLDAQHEWFSRTSADRPVSDLAQKIYAVHLYPCLAIIEKRKMEEPEVWATGRLL